MHGELKMEVAAKTPVKTAIAGTPAVGKERRTNPGAEEETWTERANARDLL